MKYVRFLWILAIALFIVPFLGFPQSFKDFLTILVAFFIGCLAWFRSQKMKHRKMMIESMQKQESGLEATK